MAEKRYIERKLLRKLMLEAGEVAEYKGVIHHVVPISIIDMAPTADVVEVVRCKDCKFFREYTKDYK